MHAKGALWGGRAGLVTLFVVAVAGAAMAAAGCASRVPHAVATEDSTLVFPARDGRGPTASITLCRGFSKKTGKPLGAGTRFSMGDKAKVRATVAIENATSLRRPNLQLHLLWLGPNGDEVYRKQVDVPAWENMDTIESALSVPPHRREPGRYTFQVYCYRELIAEKRFDLVAAPAKGGDDEEDGGG